MNERFVIEILTKEDWMIIDELTGKDYNPIDGTSNVLKGLVNLLNTYYKENQTLKELLLQFYTEDEIIAELI